MRSFNFASLCRYEATLIRKAVILEFHHGQTGMFEKILWMLTHKVRYEPIADLLDSRLQEVLDQQNSDTSVAQQNK